MAKVEICGTDTSKLVTLTEEEKRELLAKAHGGDAEARERLILGNLRLVLSVMRRFSPKNDTPDDLFQVGCIGLMKAIGSYNADKNIKIATYASRCIENEILMFIRKNSQRKREISIDEPLSVDYDGNELLLSDILGSEADSVFREMEEDEEKRIVRDAVKDLCERERVIVEMRFGLSGREELTQKEVADALGISQSYISRLEKKIMHRLLKKIE